MSRGGNVTPSIDGKQGSEVVLYQTPRAPHAPSMSPFALKLETFLRVTKIPYKNVLGGKRSPSKNKVPWIRLKGREVSDSQIIIWTLSKEYGVDLDKNLTPEQLAQAHCIRRNVEEAFYWQTYAWMFKFCYEKNRPILLKAFKPFLPSMGCLQNFVIGRLRKDALKNLYAQGTGRFTEEEANEFGKRDIQALSDILGNKPYLMGDSITVVDCAVFGALGQTLYQIAAWPVSDYLKEKTPNLVEYMERIKTQYWPDWDDVITEGSKKK